MSKGDLRFQNELNKPDREKKRHRIIAARFQFEQSCYTLLQFYST